MTVTSLAQSHIIRSRSSVFKKEDSRKNKTRKFLAVLLIFFIVSIVFFYILQVNTIAAKGYKIRTLNKRIDELQNKNKALQVSVSNLKSIHVLQSKTESFDMVKAQSIDYVDLPTASVVAAK